MASGLILTLLCVTGESSLWALALGTSLPVIALLSILRTRPRGKVLAAGITAAGVIVWLIAGGAADAVEVVRALLLHFSGLTAALPLVARPFAAILGVTCGFIGYGLTSRRVGAYPALATVLLMALLLWLGNRPDALWGLLPAIIPCVALLMVSGYDEISVTRVLPLTLVVVLLSFTGVAIGGITVQPMKEAADALRQKIYDYLFFTSARDVFSIASQGYYPQGPTQLGGAATPSERPVLRVSGSGRIYLRAVTKSSYTGSMWIDETGGRRYLWSSPRWQNLRSQTFDLTLPDETLAANLPTKTVTVTMLSDSASSLFVPQRIRELSVGSGIVPYFNAGSEIFATRNLTSGDTWTATYVDLTAGQSGLAELIDAGAQLTDAQYEDIRKLYTGLPGHLEQRLFDFARNAAGSADSPYEMARSIQSYLQAYCRYSLDIPEQASNLDFVSTFLLMTREGYCTHFASAMTVLCRMVGLPARYVEGFVADVDASGQTVVTGTSAHAWTEIYFRGVGWVTFDATPWTSTQNASSAPNQPDDLPTPSVSPSPSPSPSSSPTPSPSPEMDDSSASHEPTSTPSPAPSPSPEANLPTNTPEPAPAPPDNPPPDVPWLLLILLALIAAAGGRIWWTLPTTRDKQAKDESTRCMVWMQATHDALRMAGLRRGRSETPQQFFQRADEAVHAQGALAVVGEIETLAFYARADLLPSDAQALRQAYQTLWQGMKPLRKVRLTLYRAIVPMKMRNFTQS